ncbi:MAG: hypothetical protein R3285_09975, partial [Kiloniellales bacterium]|nr:hypothetical protein [Kiloniellales bacterium]
VLGVPVGMSLGVASEELKSNYSRVKDLCEALGETQLLFPALWGLWLNAMMRGQMRRSCGLADQVLALGKRQNDTGRQIEAHHAQWTSRFLIGEPAAALEHCSHCDALYRADEHHDLTYTYGGHDPGVCAGNVGSAVLWLLGHPRDSRKRLRSNTTLARELNHSTTLVDHLVMTMYIASFDADLAAVGAVAAEVMELSVSEKLQDYATLAKAAQGWILAEQGETEVGLALIRESTPVLLDQGDPWKPSFMGLFASVLGRKASGEEGLELLEASLAHFKANQVHWWDGELHRIKGELLLARGTRDADDGEACLLQALEIARKQEAKSLELRAAASLAGLWRERGKESEARDLLHPIVAWFPDDLASTDLTASKRLLAELADG